MSQDAQNFRDRLKQAAQMLRSAQEVIAQEEAQEAAAAEKADFERWKHLKPGVFEQEKGIFMGKYAPEDKDGNKLGPLFNAFAAPEDLLDRVNGPPKILDYEEMQDWLDKTVDFHGIHGERYADEDDLHAALIDGRYRGGWVIPPQALLDGGDRLPEFAAPNLAALKDTGDFQYRLKGALRGTVPFRYYWSCTMSDNPQDGGVWRSDLQNGEAETTLRRGQYAVCRPVRLERR